MVAKFAEVKMLGFIKKKFFTHKYLGKINWIFAQCGRLYLWVAVRCAREAPLLAPAPYNGSQNYIQIILHDYLF